MPVPVIPIVLGGAALLLMLSRKDSSYSQAPSDGSSPPMKEPAPTAKGWQEMPAALQEQVASALGALGVSPATGELGPGPVSPDAIKMATQTAALCESQGFYEVAKELRRLVNAAASKVETPPEAKAVQAVAPPGLTDAQKEAVARTLTMDRDPKVIRALLAMLQGLPPSPERDHFVELAQALILQLESAQSTTQTMQQIEQVIKSPGIAEVQAAVQPLPPAVIPVVAPAPIQSVPITSTSPGFVSTPPKPVPVPTQVPTPAPAPTVVTSSAPTAATLTYAALLPLTGSRVLKLTTPNMSGSDVGAWQNILRLDGYTNVKVDNLYGPTTTAATKKWQAERGLKADGQVGSNTRGKVGTPPSAAAPTPSKPVPPPAPLPQANPLPSAQALVFSKVLDPTPSAKTLTAANATKAETTSWQTILHALGYGGIVGAIDGSWGAKTTAATKALQTYAQQHYQDSKPIGVDGSVGPQTRRIVVARTAELKGVVVSGVA